MQSFDELLQRELTKPMELKQNGVKVGEITPLEAMVKSIVTKAGKGDIAAINVVRNMTRRPTDEDSDEARRREQRVADYERQLTDQFKGENIYDGQQQELRILAESRYMVDMLARRMQQADFEPLITEYLQNGTTRQTRNPLIDMHKEAKRIFDTDLQRLREEAMRRFITRKQMKR